MMMVVVMIVVVMVVASSLTEISDSRALGLCPFFQLSWREGEGSRLLYVGF